MRIRLLFILLNLFLLNAAFSQCPQVYDGTGVPSSKPYWINCTGGAYTLNFSSPSSISSYTVIWGDGTANTTGASLAASTFITHSYAAVTDTFMVQLITSAPSCTLSGVMVMERPVNASIEIPVGGVTTACAPATLAFVNSSTDVSQTTSFSWDFGDGSPVTTYSYTNDNQTVTHTYNKGTVNCQTIVTLSAKNYCTFGTPTKAQFNPIQIYDKDKAAITPDAVLKCWPDNSFTFTNTTARNCFAQGNNGIRYEKWDFGNYWGTGHDSIINWTAWPPSFPKTIAYPALGNYTVILYDSNECGVDTSSISVSIVSKPTAGLTVANNTVCVGTTFTFTNTSSTGYAYAWNYGDNSTYTPTGYGPQTHSYASAGTYTVSVVALVSSAPNSCSDTARLVVSVLPSPVSNFTFTPPIGCNSVTNTFTDGSTGAVTWQWSFGNGNTFTGQVPPTQTYTTGTYTVSLQTTSADNCTNTKKHTVTVFQKPVPQFATSVLCAQNTITFTDNSTHTTGDNITTWGWNFGDGSIRNTTQNPTHTYTTAATYSVLLSVATAHCSDSVVVPLTLNPLPTVSFANVPDSGCPALIVTFTNTTLGASTYNWNFGNGSISTNASPTQTFSNNTTSTITFTTSLVATSAAGCKDSTKNTIKVFGKPIAIFGSDAFASCAPFNVTFTNTSVAAVNYLWNFGDGSATSVSVTPAHFYQNTTGFLQNYTVTLHVTNAGGCQDSTKQVVQAYPQAQFNFSSLPDSGCTQLNVNFPASAGAVSYKWDFGDGSPTSTGSSPLHTFTNTTAATKIFTVELVAINAFNCTDTARQPIKVFPKPTASFSLNVNAGCSAFTPIITNHSAGDTGVVWNFGDGGASILANPVYTFNNISTVKDSFNIQLIVTNASACKDTAKKYVTIFPKVTASFTCDSIGCSLFKTTFVNSSQNTDIYAWDFGDGSLISTLKNPSHTYTNTTTSAITYTVELYAESSTYGCTSIITKQITVLPKPVAFFSLNVNAGCSVFTPIITNNSVGDTGVVWNFGDGGTSILANPVHSFTNTALTKDSFNVQLIVTNASACKDTIKKYVYVLPKVKASFTSDTIGCSPLKISFINSSQGANGYIWLFGDATTTLTTTNPVHTYTNTTGSIKTFTAQLIGNNNFSCADTAIQKITIYPKPTASFSLNANSGCSSFTPIITNHSAGDTGVVWSFGDGSTSILANPIHSFTNTALIKDSFNVQLIVTNAFGCKDTTKKYVSVLPKVKASFTSDTIGCSPLKVSFINSSQGANGYVWNFGDAITTTVTTTNPVHIYTNTLTVTQTYTAQLISNNSFNCADTATQKITIYPKPKASFILSHDSGCTSFTPIFTNNSIGASTAIWNFGDGTTSSFANHTFVNTSLTYQDSFNVQLIVTNAPYNCKDTAKKYVYVFPKVITSFYADTPICAPVNVFFHNTTQSTAITTYTWNFGDGNPLDNSFAPSHVYNDTTGNTLFYTATLAATNSFGCTSTFSHTYDIYPKPTALFNLTPSGAQIFPAATIGLINQTANASSFTNHWNFGDGHTSTLVSPTNHTYNTWGTYSITLAVSSTYCKDSITKTTTIIPPPPIASFNGGQNGCTPLSVTFQSTSQFGTSFLWNFGDGNTQSGADTIVTHQYSDTIVKSYTVKLVVTGPGGKDSMTVANDVTVYPLPSAIFSIQPLIVTVGIDPIVCYNQSKGATSYIWNFGDNTPDVTDVSPSHIYQQQGQFAVTLTAISQYGCKATLTSSLVTARTETNIQIPNAFTPSPAGPSTDGVYNPASYDNDIFHPNISGMQTYELDIFNRWGELLFVTKDVKVGWDGYYKGKLCEQGTYIWKIRGVSLDGLSIEKAGDLTLLR